MYLLVSIRDIIRFFSISIWQVHKGVRTQNTFMMSYFENCSDPVESVAIHRTNRKLYVTFVTFSHIHNGTVQH